MNQVRQLPEFVSASWYTDPHDHRCPHDAWLESLEVSEPAKGTRNENRRTAIAIKLFGAYHDGHIVLRYRNVRKYSLDSSSCHQGLGDWLKDEFSISETGFVLHRIDWA